MISLIKKLDWKLNFAILFLVFASLVSLLGADISLFWKQAAWLVLGSAIALVIIKFDWRSFVNYNWVIWGIYSIANFLLLVTLVVAPKVRGQRNWIPLGPFKFEPSVFAALALIIVLASFFKKEHKGIAHVSNI